MLVLLRQKGQARQGNETSRGSQRDFGGIRRSPGRPANVPQGNPHRHRGVYPVKGSRLILPPRSQRGEDEAGRGGRCQLGGGPGLQLSPALPGAFLRRVGWPFNRPPGGPSAPEESEAEGCRTGGNLPAVLILAEAL